MSHFTNNTAKLVEESAEIISSRNEVKNKKWLGGHIHQTENKVLRSWVQTPGHASNFSTPGLQKISKGPAVRLIVI